MQMRHAAVLCAGAMVDALETGAEPYALPLVGLLADTLADKVSRARGASPAVASIAGGSCNPTSLLHQGATGPSPSLHLNPIRSL